MTFPLSATAYSVLAFTATMLRGATLQVCVKDPSGAVIPTAAVVVYARGTQERTTVSADSTGCARFDRLPSGNYDLTIEVSGFATEQISTSFDGNADRSTDVQMHLGHTRETTVVSASRTSEEIDGIPASVSAVPGEDFASRQSTAISDVLGKLPNVELGGSPRASGQIPSIRAYAGTEIITLVDGARINFSNGLFAPILIEPGLLGEAEVVRGTSSSTYGSGAMGGVLALRTRTAREELDSGRNWGGQLGGGYNSGDDSQHYNGMFYGASAKFDGLAAFGYRDFHAIKQGGGTELRPNNGHDYSGLLNLGWRATEKWRLRLSDEYYQERVFRPNNPQADATFPFLQHNHIQQNVGSFSAVREEHPGDEGLRFSLYRSSTKFWIDGETTPAAPATTSLLTTWGGSVQNTSQIRGGVLGNHRITYGLDSYDDFQYAVSAGAPNPVIPVGHQRDYGLFALDRIALGERWTLTPGLRWDHFSTNVDVNNGTQPNTSLSRVSPHVALSFSPAAPVMIYADFGQAFRAPVLSELYQSLTLATGFANFVPNPGLQDERSTQTEAGAVFRGHGIFGSRDSFRFRAAGFYSGDRDLINKATIGFFKNPFLGNRPILQAQNIYRAERWGGEFEAEYSSGGWFASLAGSHMESIDRTRGTGLYSPPNKLVATVYYQFSAPNLSLYWTGTAVAAQDYDSALTRRRGGYGLQDVFGSWYPNRLRRLRFDLGIANLFDKRYSIYKQSTSFPYVPEMGRNVRINMAVRF